METTEFKSKEATNYRKTDCKCCGTCIKSHFDSDDEMYCYERGDIVLPSCVCDEYD